MHFLLLNNEILNFFFGCVNFIQYRFYLRYISYSLQLTVEEKLF